MSDDFHGLFNSPGSYGLISLGATQAVTLRGDTSFRGKAINLFSSFGGESKRGAWVDSRQLVVREGAVINSCFFCLPKERVQLALRLYLFGQLYAEASKVEVLDEEGDYVESLCPTEDTLMEQAAQLADDFISTHMGADYAVVPESFEVAPAEEYKLGLVDTCDYS